MAHGNSRTTGTSIQKMLQKALITTSETALLIVSMSCIMMEAASGQARPDEQFSVLARVVAPYSEAALECNDPTAGSEALGALASIPEIQSALLLDRQGAIFAHHGSNPRVLATVAREQATGVTHKGLLARGFNAMTRGLRGLVLVVRQAIADVGELARALGERAGTLADAATRQSRAISEAAPRSAQWRIRFAM